MTTPSPANAYEHARGALAATRAALHATAAQLADKHDVDPRHDEALQFLTDANVALEHTLPLLNPTRT